MVVVGCLFSQVFGAWWGTREDFAGVSRLDDKESEENDHTE